MNPSGIFLIDKPAGITSFGVIRKLRKITGFKKMGHAGTLDPLATGLLPVFMGKATRTVKFFLHDEKEYLVTMKLGTETDTGDLEGKVIQEKPYSNQLPTEEQIEQIAEQIPPRYSAIKYNGKKAYKLARKNIDFTLPSRRIEILEFEYTKKELPYVSYRVRVSKGTYVRVLSQQIVQLMGTCATTTSIRRSQIGKTSLQQSVSLENINSENWQQHLQPLQNFFPHIPRLTLKKNEVIDYKNGRQLPLKAIADGFYMALNKDAICIGFAQVNNQQLQPKLVLI
jgi:tRNA pseudouridine55 synthase